MCRSASKRPTQQIHQKIFGVVETTRLCQWLVLYRRWLTTLLLATFNMPLNFSAAHSSRITKPGNRKSPLSRKSPSSPLKLKRAPTTNKKTSISVPTAEDSLVDYQVSYLQTLNPRPSLSNVAEVIKHIHTTAFEAIPEAGGFNSVRIAGILNYRKSLPPVATLTHVHALTSSPTQTEREISRLVSVGVLRRLSTPGRGIGRSSISEGLCIAEDVRRLVQESPCLSNAQQGEAACCEIRALIDRVQKNSWHRCQISLRLSTCKMPRCPRKTWTV